MKKFSAFLLFISSLFLLCACGSSSTGDNEPTVDEYAIQAEVLMGTTFDAADPFFKDCVQDAIADDISTQLAAGTITAVDEYYDLTFLTSLSCKDLGILGVEGGISGIDSLTGLTHLELDGNGLEDDDINGIKGGDIGALTTLWHLNLANNALTDPDFTDNTTLNSLYLLGNELSSLAVYDLGSLIALNLYKRDDADPDTVQLTLSDVESDLEL